LVATVITQRRPPPTPLFASFRKILVAKDRNQNISPWPTMDFIIMYHSQRILEAANFVDNWSQRPEGLQDCHMPSVNVIVYLIVDKVIIYLGSGSPGKHLAVSMFTFFPLLKKKRRAFFY
jgi:hypothetical protein